MTREARQLSYVGVLVDITGLDQEELAARPPDEQFLVLLHAVEQRGATLEDVQGWMAVCDPEGREPGPGDDPVGCFREKAEAAMHEAPSLGATVAFAALGAFALVFAAMRLR